MREVPEELRRWQREHERLDGELKALHSTEFGTPQALILATIGCAMFVSATVLAADHPFYGGVGATLAVLGAGRWLFLRSRSRTLNAQIQPISQVYFDAGFYPPINGRIDPLPKSQTPRPS